MNRRLKIVISTTAPLFYALFTACGGDNSPPPPLGALPQVTSQITCADINLTAALDKCKKNLASALPAIMQASDQGSAIALADTTGKPNGSNVASLILTWGKSGRWSLLWPNWNSPSGVTVP